MKTIVQVFWALLFSASLTSKAFSQNQSLKQPDTTSVNITTMASLVQDLLNTNNALQNRLDEMDKAYRKRFDDILRDSPPIGTILAFGGSEKAVLPDGWMFCYGNALSSRDYKLLYEKIGTSWGNGKQGKGFNPPTTDFNIPDLRGLFLRGVAGEVNVDPQKGDRLSRFDGLAGNNVGSYQDWATGMPKNVFKIEKSGEHRHNIMSYKKDERKANTSNTDNDPAWVGQTEDHLTAANNASLHSHTILGGDNETRPVNVYVNYIIKVK